MDTNIVTAVLKKNPKVRNKLRDVEIQKKVAFMICITFYGIKRGLLYVKATRQLSEFEQLCKKYNIKLACCAARQFEGYI